MNELATQDQIYLENLIREIVPSPCSRRVYLGALARFQAFARDRGGLQVNRASLMAYRAFLGERQAPASVNVALSAIKSVVRELAKRDLIDPHDAGGIAGVENVPVRGQRAGHWLSEEQVERLMSSIDTSKLIGKRDRCLLGIMISTGIRRAEVCSLQVEQLKQVNGYTCFIDVLGKGSKLRSLTLPAKVDQWTREWLDAAEITSGPLIRSVDKHGHVGGSIGSDGARFITEKHSRLMGIAFRCHDLRRTHANLSLDAGATLDQIQTSLGHSSSVVTEKYLARIFRPEKAAGLRIGMFAEGRAKL